MSGQRRSAASRLISDDSTYKAGSDLVADGGWSQV